MSHAPTDPASPPASTPVSLWIVGVLALLWNAMGAVDYTMTELRAQTWVEAMTPEQLAYIDAYPAWLIALWAIGVWGGVFGSVLLLLRKKLAVPVYLASFLGATALTAVNFTHAEGREFLDSTGAKVFAVVIVVVALLLLVFARSMRARGVLR